MRKLTTFSVMVATQSGFKETAKVEAHYMTGPYSDTGRVQFWVKPRWYSRARCVGVVDWRYVVAVRNEATSSNWLKEAGVQL